MSGRGGVHALVGRAHEERVLAILRERGGLNRAQIVARSGLSRTTLSEITGELLERRAIVVVNTDAAAGPAAGGRPSCWRSIRGRASSSASTALSGRLVAPDVLTAFAARFDYVRTFAAPVLNLLLKTKR